MEFHKEIEDQRESTPVALSKQVNTLIWVSHIQKKLYRCNKDLMDLNAYWSLNLARECLYAAWLNIWYDNAHSRPVCYLNIKGPWLDLPRVIHIHISILPNTFITVLKQPRSDMFLTVCCYCMSINNLYIVYISCQALHTHWLYINNRAKLHWDF